MKKLVNHQRIKFSALSENESFARMVTTGFVMNIGITPSLLADIKTVVSEAVTNAIVHGYKNREDVNDYVFLDLKYYDDKTLVITVADKGCGIENVEQAMEPFFTTDKEGERSGMGLPIMDAFSDSIKLKSRIGSTCVVMKKKIA